ncbi:MAG TPA: diguanylate cyclase [Caulobacteraceae bacterium]|jgi:diguanylate cyclase (GGDEF)-like protein|nr:diguanylate cyclase [Caulobacteraceae bacterium]
MSISRRLWLTTLTTLVLLGVTLVTLLVAVRVSDSTAQARHVAYRRISAIETILSDLKDAETGQRGYVLTGVESYLTPFLRASRSLPVETDELRAGSADDPRLQADGARLGAIVTDKLAELRLVIAARRSAGFSAALRIIGTDRGKALMEQARTLADDMEAGLRVQVQERDQQIRQTYSLVLAVLVLGGLLIASTSVFINLWVVASVRRQQEAFLAGVRRVAEGDLTSDIPAVGGIEFARLADAFNRMVADLRDERLRRESAEKALARSNATLKTQADGATRKSNAAEALSRLAARLTACDDEAEVAEVIGDLAPLIVRSGAGALYTRAGSEVTLRKVAEWSEPASAPAVIQPSECRGIRDGRPHVVHWTDSEAACAHVDHDTGCACRCLPIIAQEQLVGLLYLEERDMALALPLADVIVLSESIGTTISNLRLRDSLKDLSIRDALTGLFNRRHLQETLSIELPRADRTSTPLSLIILDLDNFKKFNDTFGHDAGDAVLRALGSAITRNLRQGDVAFRYGGEEFMVLLPQSSQAQAAAIAERVRTAIEALRLVYDGRSLGGFSASLGVATFPDCGETAEALILAADRALYSSKATGKNRVSFAAEAA